MPDSVDPAAEHARRLLRACDLDRTPPVRECPRGTAVEWACSGAMALTGTVQGTPEFANGALASAASGAALALATLAPNAGFDQLDGPALFGERAAIGGLSRGGDISAGRSARLLPAEPVDVVLNLPRDEDWQLIPALFEVHPSELTSTRDWRAVRELAAKRNAKKLVERGRMMGLAIATTTRPPSKKDPFILHHATESPRAGRTERRIRLLDLSSLWAGPLATSLLASAGIEVLKLESARRPDGARQGPAAFFDLMNGRKRGCALDLDRADDRAIFDRLLEAADIVVDSSRPRALSHLGIDAASWVKARPGRLWTSITGYGRDREWIAFGDDAAVAAGLAEPVEGSDSRLRFCGDAIADPLTGLHAAVFILAQLHHGRGGLLDLSLVDIAAYAAATPHDGLTRPIERDSGRWILHDEERRVLIAPPRTRPTQAVAPTLAAPSPRLISDWTGAC